MAVCCTCSVGGGTRRSDWVGVGLDVASLGLGFSPGRAAWLFLGGSSASSDCLMMQRLHCLLVQPLHSWESGATCQPHGHIMAL